MKDRLEDFISKNRDSFDVHQPGERIWKGIETTLHRTSITPFWKKALWRAAVVVAIFAASFLLEEYLHFRRDRLAAVNEEAFRDIPELHEAEVYYSGLLEDKLRQIEPLLSAEPELGETLDRDLSELDSIYAELQQDLRDNIANDEVVEAMIQNYVLKIQVLEDLLEYLDGNPDNNDSKTGQHEI